jgi:ubiquinone/menaquinone biosynthesis C-methylase UbiE
VALTTIGLDAAECLLVSVRTRLTHTACGDALALPFASRSVDVVLCSQLLHHFDDADCVRLITELDRVARHRVIIADLRRSWIAASGFWMASFPLGFHAITRHDGFVSVMRGFTTAELGSLVERATGVLPVIHRRLGYRLTASWTPRPAVAA